MPRGGTRPGAGRPRKAQKFETAINRAERQIADRLPELIELQMELARGVLVEMQTEDGSKVFKTPPDRAAGQYLINRIMGKPTERKEVAHEFPKPLEEMSDDELRAIAES